MVAKRYQRPCARLSRPAERYSSRPPGPRAFDQPVGVRQHLFGKTRRDLLFAEGFEDHVPFAPGKRDQTKRDAVAVGDLVDASGLFHGAVQPLGKAFRLRPRDLARQFVALRGARDLLAHVFQRDGDHLVRQRAVQPRQLVEPQKRDDPAQGRPLHQKRVKGEAGGQDADLALDADGHTQVFRHRQRQRQRDGPAQPPPEDGDAIGSVDPRRKFHRRQQRQHDIEHEQPRGRRRDDHHADQRQVAPLHIRQQAGHEEGGKQEDQRPRPMRKHVPDIAQVGPVAGRKAAGTKVVQGHPGHDHGDHPRYAKDLIGHQIGDIGQGDAERDLRQRIAAHRCEQRDADPGEHPADADPAQHQCRKTDQRIAQRGVRHAQHDKGQEKAEERNRGGVVQQALALDDPRQALRGGDVAKDADHRRRVGGGDDCAQHEAGHQWQRGKGGQGIADGQGCHHHGHDRHDQDGNPVVGHPAQVQPQRDLKQQRRQQDIEKDAGTDGDLEPFDRQRQAKDRAAMGHQKHRAEADQRADDRQNHGIGQPGAVGQGLAQGDDDKERGNDADERDHTHDRTSGRMAAVGERGWEPFSECGFFVGRSILACIEKALQRLDVAHQSVRSRDCGLARAGVLSPFRVFPVWFQCHAGAIRVPDQKPPSHAEIDPRRLGPFDPLQNRRPARGRACPG